MQNKKIAVINMAFGTGSESSESGVGFDKFIGVAPYFVIGVNPNAEGLKKIYPSRENIEEPSYIYAKEDDPVKGMFVTFYIKTNKDHKECNGVEVITRASYLIKGEPFTNKDKTKVQCINNYGDTIWLTPEQLKTKSLPEYAVNSSFITEGLRPAFIGEADLVNFLKTYINIPNSRNYKDGNWVSKTGEDLQKAVCGFSMEEVKQILSGNVSTIKSAIKLQPNNQIKFLTGVRTTDSNKEYQEVFSKYPMKLRVTDYKKLDTEITSAKDSGAFSNTTFGVFPYKFQKYEVDSTSFTQENNGQATAVESDPFAGFGA